MNTRVKWMPYSTKEHVFVRAFSRNQMYIWKYQSIGETKETKTTKEVKAKTIKNHRENQTTKKPTLSDPCRPKWTWVWKFVLFLFCLVSPMVFDSFRLGLFGCFGFFGFPYGFDMFRCTFDSPKKLGRGRAPLLNKAFTLHEFQFIRGFLV